MILPLPNGTTHESVLKYKADRLRKYDYVPTSEVPAEGSNGDDLIMSSAT